MTAKTQNPQALIEERVYTVLLSALAVSEHIARGVPIGIHADGQLVFSEKIVRDLVKLPQMAEEMTVEELRAHFAEPSITIAQLYFLPMRIRDGFAADPAPGGRMN